MTDPTAGQAAAIGARVHALRSERGLSMRDLAGQAGVSQPFVSKLESGRQLPSVPTVYALAAALGTTPGALLAPAGADAASDVHLPLTDGDGASSVRVIGAPGGAAQLYLFDLAAGEGDGGFVRHAGEELLVVLDGVAISSEEGRPDVEVREGDSRTVDTSVPHGLRASASGRTRVLLVCTEPPAAVD
jgi:transcriptional regulator with XRE-family HTH domain